jgi:hypothetical protein
MNLLLALLVDVTAVYVLAHLLALMTFVIRATPRGLEEALSSKARRRLDRERYGDQT